MCSAYQRPGAFCPRLFAGIALSALSSVLLVLGFPPHSFWPLIWVGLVPMMVSQQRVMPERLSWLAYGIGVGGFFWGYLHGIFTGNWMMEKLPFFIAVAARLMSRGDRAFHQRTGYRWFVLHGPVIWTGVETIRGLLPVVGSWGFVSYACLSRPG
ncbi:MAG: hypothetical protein AB1497_09660 [Bacillota bacterium]